MSDLESAIFTSSLIKDNTWIQGNSLVCPKAQPETNIQSHETNGVKAQAQACVFCETQDETWRHMETTDNAAKVGCTLYFSENLCFSSVGTGEGCADRILCRVVYSPEVLALPSNTDV